MNQRILTARFLPLIAILVVGVFPSLAATITWTNTASGVWNTAANWNPNSVPGSSDTAIITNAGVTVSLNGAATVGGIILGTNGAGTVTLSLAWQTLTLDGPLTVNPTGSFTVASGTLTGATNAVLSGAIGWTGGLFAGTLTIASNGTLTVAGNGGNNDLPGCVLTNYGTVAWASGNLRGGGGTAIYNFGLWSAQSDQFFNGAYGGGATFNNSGTFRKSGGTSEFTNGTIFSVAFNQLAGVLDVQNGTNGLAVAFQGGGNFTGGYITTNQFGLTLLSSGNFVVNGTVTGTNTWEDAGNLVGVNVINGALNWVAGNWSGASSVTIAPNAELLVSGGTGNNDMPGTSVTNNGTVVWASGTIRGNGGTAIYNNGLWNAQSDQTLNAAYGVTTTFNNFGTFRKTGSSGGNTQFQTGVAFNNPGILDSQVGNIALQGAYNLTNGTLNFGINNLTNYGTITLAGAATLTGTVSANLNNGFKPGSGNSFTNLYYGSFNGAFINASLPLADVWKTNYYSTMFALNVAAVKTGTSVTLGPITLNAGQAVIQVNGPEGGVYVLQSSGTLNVEGWSSLLTNTPSSLPFNMTDTNAGTFPNRFYRIRLGP